VGPQGPQGAEGPRGPSNAYARFTGGPVPIRPTLAEVNHLDLPAGAYVVVARVRFKSTAPGTRYTYCSVRAEGDTDSAVTRLWPTWPRSRAVMMFTHVFAAPGRVTVSCKLMRLGRSGVVAQSRLLAIQVGTLTVQP
jgi:hypothetical protein